MVFSRIKNALFYHIGNPPDKLTGPETLKSIPPSAQFGMEAALRQAEESPGMGRKIE
jgi:hypothetical protein